MKITCLWPVLGLVALAACQTGTTAPAVAPLAAGDEGEAYCEGPPPTDPVAMENWNQTCFPDGNR